MIYLVEDDANIREFVLYALTGQGYDAQGFEKPSQFFAALERQVPELVLLDLMLPEEDGLSVLKRLRAAPTTRHVPVIILSAKDTEFDKVLGLDNGADDYLPKPFGMLELFSRIRAVPRRRPRSTAWAPCGSAPPGGRPWWTASTWRSHPRSLRSSAFSSPIPGWSSPAVRFRTRSGAWNTWVRPARWTSTSAPCVKSWGTAGS